MKRSIWKNKREVENGKKRKRKAVHKLFFLASRLSGILYPLLPQTLQTGFLYSLADLKHPFPGQWKYVIT